VNLLSLSTNRISYELYSVHLEFSQVAGEW